MPVAKIVYLVAAKLVGGGSNDTFGSLVHMRKYLFELLVIITIVTAFFRLVQHVLWRRKYRVVYLVYDLEVKCMDVIGA